MFGSHSVASTALVDAQVSVRVPEERRIAWTAAVSILVHVIVLASVVVITAPSADFSSVPELVFDTALEDGHDTEHDDSAAVERSAAPTTMVSETSPAAIADNESFDRAPPVIASASPAPARDAPATDEKLVDLSTASASVTSLPSANVPAPDETATTENSEILTTSGESEQQLPVAAQVAKTDEPQVAIPSTQQALLAHKIVESAQGFQDTDLKETRLSWQQDGQEYSALLTRQPAADNTGIDRMIVEIVTRDHGKRMRTRMQMKRLAFSHFTQLVDRWDQEVQLHDDEIGGRFHSNTTILLGYDRAVAPKFFGKVTTAARGFTLANSSGHKDRAEIFRGGIETRAGRIDLPAKFLPFAASPGAQKVAVQSYNSDTRITFYADGTYGWCPAGSKDPEQRQPLSSATTYIVGARNVTFYVKGTVSGKVLVYSPDLIVVEGHLVYAHDPRASVASEDYLGLVSDNYVEVARQHITGRGDLEIDGALYAKRRFVVEDEHAPGSATLYIYGSLTAGSISATEPRYSTRITFDPRFEEQRPPGFPVTNRYEVEGWDAQWQPVKEDE